MISIQEVLDNCNPYLNLLKKVNKGYLLTRGTHDSGFMIEKYTHCSDSRTPRNVSLKIHNAINEHYYSKFGWKIRNGIFTYSLDCSNKNIKQLEYGPTFLFFPKGEFKFSYDINIFDLKPFEYDLKYKEIEDLFGHLNYNNSNLENAMNMLIENDRSPEIMIDCIEYYLVDLSYAQTLVQRIWKEREK